MGLSLVAIIAPLIIFGVRPDLLHQPPAQLAVQALLWVLCLVVFPAIGVGLLFVGRAARYALAATAIGLSIVAATGWPFAEAATTAHVHAGGFPRCLPVTLAVGGLLVVIGVLSGAFVQRRRVTAVFWLAAGMALVALNVVTWHCPQSGTLHVVPSHLGGAVMLLALAAVVGVWARRRTEPERD